ncbi:MAG: hypothetical protein JXO72_10620 [Vicinamibacteria bacterium]|nr:hypothetical protein [Vicinamibacteria bacterium]
MNCRHARALALSALVGLFSAAGVLVVRSSDVRLTPSSVGWRFLVRGGAPERERFVLLLSGIERHEPRLLLLSGAADDAGIDARIDVDQRSVGAVRITRRREAVIVVPSSRAPGARIDVSVSAPVRLSSIAIRGVSAPPIASALLAFLLTMGLTLYVGRFMRSRSSVSIGIAFGSLLVAAHTPALVWLAVPGGVRYALLAPLMALTAIVSAIAAPRSDRRIIFQGSLLLGAIVFGAWVRGAFLPSAGSWDTEYWKAWTHRAVDAGLTRVYGDPDSVPPGHFWAQFNGQEQRFEASYDGREFPVDYPPLAMALWSLSYRMVARYVTGLDAAEIRNVSVKLPAVAGDLAALVAILWVLRRRPRRAVALAVLYWALPVSWLSSAVLGYSDATYAPLSAVALCAAGSGAPVLAGLALATACLLKPTAGVIAPVIFAGLIRRRGASWRAALAAAIVGVVAFAPYAASGTLATAVIHLYRIVHQRTLSGGFPNPWWLIGHMLTMPSKNVAWHGPVQYASVDLIPEARVWGLVLFLLATVAVLYGMQRCSSSIHVMIAGGVLVFSYGLLAVGVHENHPHALFLILLATGLAQRRWRLFFTGVALSYVLTMLCLSGLGRFYGTRYVAIDPIIDLVLELRMASGLDITLLLVPINVLLLISALALREHWKEFETQH